MQNKYYYNVKNGTFMKQKTSFAQPGDFLEYICWDSNDCKEVWKGFDMKTSTETEFEYIYPSNHKEIEYDVEKERISAMSKANFIPLHSVQAYEPRKYFEAVVKSVFGEEE